MKTLIKTKSFKDFIENTGRGCRMIFAQLQNNQIHIWCKANSQNNIIFKIILNEYECVELINSYNLYKQEEITIAYQNYLNKLKNNISL